MVSLVAVAILSALFTYYSNATGLPREGDQNWWKHAVFYQIYPRSFKDSDGNGIGDLEGITSKLDHFVDAGVTAIWLSPIYKSPQLDMGYDISDYMDVDPLFGTLEQMDRLIEEVHKKGLRIIMDFVPNHTSNDHEWFKMSEDSVEGYEDFYIWKDAVDGSYPNNWISVFNGPAWEWSEKRQQYYYHAFAIAQPDLNYRNPQLVQAMKDVMTFWMDRGVDGFRIDAVNFLVEDDGFLDEPLSGIEGAEPNQNSYLDHIYTKDQPGTLDMIYQWRAHVDEYAQKNGGDAKVLMTESYTDIKTTMLYYGTPDGDRLGAHFTFNFFFITNVNLQSTAQDFVNIINMWYDNMPSIYVPNWVTGNHDNHRVATRLGPENVDGFNMLVMLLPGVGVTYNADEIGQEDGEVTFEECEDPPVCGDEQAFFQIGRDFERTPVQWDTTRNAGFSEANKTWLPVSEKYLTTNLADQVDPHQKSHYNVYKALLELRQMPPFQQTRRPNVVAISESVFAFTVSEEETYVVILNIGDEEQVVSLGEYFEEATDNSYVEVAISSVNSVLEVGSTYDSLNLTITGHDSLAAKLVFDV